MADKNTEDSGQVSWLLANDATHNNSFAVRFESGESFRECKERRLYKVTLTETVYCLSWVGRQIEVTFFQEARSFAYENNCTSAGNCPTPINTAAACFVMRSRC